MTRTQHTNGRVSTTGGNHEIFRYDDAHKSWELPLAAQYGRVDRRLVRRDDALIQLLGPPFDKAHLNPVISKGMSRGCAKMRAVYACGDLDGDGVRRVGRQTARVGTVGHDQPGQPCEAPGGRCDL